MRPFTYSDPSCPPALFLLQDNWNYQSLWWPYPLAYYFQNPAIFPLCSILPTSDYNTLDRSPSVETKLSEETLQSSVKKGNVAQTAHFQGEQTESIKVIQNKTKDLMRPLARLLYSYFKKLVQASQILSQTETQEIRIFSRRVDELRSKRPCKFTEVMVNFLKTASPGLRRILQQYLYSAEFRHWIVRSQWFKHWKNRDQLVWFLRKFVLENEQLMKPTKFYKLGFRKPV